MKDIHRDFFAMVFFLSEFVCNRFIDPLGIRSNHYYSVENLITTGNLKIN